MSGLGIDVTVSGEAIASVRNLARGFTPARVQPIVGRSARNSTREHLFGLNSQRPNALGGPRTNFFAGAGRATQFRVEGDFVIVSINQVGIRLRYFGGTVKPRVKKYLTIPAIPEAHGKRASEFRDLHFAFERDAQGRLRPALVQGAASVLGFRRTGAGVRVRAIGERQRRVVFWLVKSVTQKADESVLPRGEQVTARAVREVDAYARLLWQRQQPPSAS